MLSFRVVQFVSHHHECQILFMSGCNSTLHKGSDIIFGSNTATQGASHGTREEFMGTNSNLSAYPRFSPFVKGRTHLKFLPFFNKLVPQPSRNSHKKTKLKCVNTKVGYMCGSETNTPHEITQGRKHLSTRNQDIARDRYEPTDLLLILLAVRIGIRFASKALVDI